MFPIVPFFQLLKI